MVSPQAYCVIVMFFVGLKVILCKQKAAMSLECVGRFDLGLFISVALDIFPTVPCVSGSCRGALCVNLVCFSKSQGSG